METTKVLYTKPSKSQRKREMTSLQKLGEQLTILTNDKLKTLSLPETLLDAIQEYKNINAREGKRRQLQFIGKLMRSLNEEELEHIHSTLDAWQGTSKAQARFFQAMERERDNLLNNENALTDFISRYPNADIQHLRSLIRQAKKEQANQSSPKAYRELFQIIKSVMTNAQQEEQHE